MYRYTSIYFVISLDFCSALTSGNANIMVPCLMMVMIVYIECHDDVMVMLLCRKYMFFSNNGGCEAFLALLGDL